MPAQPAIRPAMGLPEWAMLILLGIIWGGSFFFARVAVAEIPPLTLVLFRVAIAGAALQLYLLVRGPSFGLALAHVPMFFALAILNNVIPFSLIFLGQTALGAGLASVLNATTPFWTILIANQVTSDEKLSWNKVAGVLFGIAGTAVMIGPGVVAGLGGPVWPKFALVGASVSYALALMVARRFKGVPPAIVATGQLTASTIVMIPVALLANGTAGLFSASPHVWAAVFAPGAAVDGLRLSALFHHHRARRRHQCLAGDADRPGQRHPARRVVSLRAARTVRFRRNGPDRRRSPDDRRSPAEASSGNRTAVRLSFLHRPRRAISVSKTSPKAKERVGFPTIMSHCSTVSACQNPERA